LFGQATAGGLLGGQFWCRFQSSPISTRMINQIELIYSMKYPNAGQQ
jgi:hypothetical protein